MTRTEITITVEHNNSKELNKAIKEVLTRMSEGYTAGNYEENDRICVEFSKTQNYITI